MTLTLHNEFGDDAGNTQYRVLVAGQQYPCSLHESNSSIVTRATRASAVKELDSDLKLSGETNGVWLNVDSNNALEEVGDQNSPSPDEQIRRRMTFKDQCASLYTVSNYGDFILSLAQLVPSKSCLFHLLSISSLCSVLDRMRLAGFIHGDISPINCLVDTRARHIKISDIEHARQYDSQVDAGAPSMVSLSSFILILMSTEMGFR